MLETLKRRKQFSLRNKQSRKQSRISNGISKKYKSPRGKYTQRLRKITLSRYNNFGNVIGGGIFAFFTSEYHKLRSTVKKIKEIIKEINSLEKEIDGTMGSYEVKSKDYKIMADKTAQFQTEYIIAKRRNVILKNYRKDSDEVNLKTDRNVIATIDAEIKRSESDYKHSEKMVAAQFKEVGKDIKNFIYLSNKYQKGLKKFEKIDELRKKVETYQLEISHVRDQAQLAEGRSDLGKAEKATLAKYLANKSDYDYVVSLTDQNLETVRALQQKSATLTATMEFNKNQFGMFKSEGYESKGAQGAIKVGSKLKTWADLTDKLAASLLGVYDNSKGIITTLEEMKTAITKCRTELVTVPEYINKEANANAILWFEHDVEDMIKVVKELKKHFGDMKNEFYNQIAAENMYSNYNYNSKFLRVIEIRLKFYKWMIDKAFTKDDLDKMGKQMTGTAGTAGTARTVGNNRYASGGYYSLSGGAGRPGRPGRPTGRPTKLPGNTDACSHLTVLTPFKDIQLKYLAPSLMKITSGLNTSDNDCYKLTKPEFINCIRNKFNRYLLAAFLESNILDSARFNANTNNLQDNIAKFSSIIKFLDANTNWDDATKKQVVAEFNGFKPTITLHPDIVNIKSSKKITDLFDAAGAPIAIATAEEKALQTYLASKLYLKEFLGKLVSHVDFYGVLEYDKEKTSIIDNYITTLPLSPVGAVGAVGAVGSVGAVGAIKSIFNDKLNSKELNEITTNLDSIKDGLAKYGIYPSDDFNKIVELLYEVGDAIENIFGFLGDSNAVDISIKGMEQIKEYLDNIKYKIDINDVNININDDEVLDDMMHKLNTFNSEYQFMNKFYYSMKDTTDLSLAKKALIELIEQYTKDINDKEALGKIAIRISEKPEYRPVAPTSLISSTSIVPMNLQVAPAAPGLPAPAFAPGVGIISSVATKSIANTQAQALKATLEEAPDWLKDLDTRSKNNKDYISNILIRIPNEYPKQYLEVKQQLKNMQEKLKGLIGPGNTLAKLSDDFQTMTTTLIDIKSIESDLIDVKVKSEPKRFLGLGSYIPEPLSLEKKSEARNDTKKISELVKGMMQNTFFEDRGDKEKAKEAAINLFDRILPILSKDHPPNISYDDQSKLRKPDALDAFLDKLSKTITNAGIVSGQTAHTQDIRDSQMKFCRLINKLKEIVTDTTDVQKILVVSAKIGDCSSILQKDNKKGGKHGQQYGQQYGQQASRP